MGTKNHERTDGDSAWGYHGRFYKKSNAWKKKGRLTSKQQESSILGKCYNL